MKTTKFILLLALITFVYGCAKTQSESDDTVAKKAAEALRIAQEAQRKAQEELELQKQAYEEYLKALEAFDRKVMEMIAGVYSGIFTVTYNVGTSESWSESVSTTLELKNGRYTCSYKGSGDFLIKGDKVIFKDINYWTANFDWNLILDGEYDFTFDGKKLIISAVKNGVGYYEYELEKE